MAILLRRKQLIVNGFLMLKVDVGVKVGTQPVIISLQISSGYFGAQMMRSLFKQKGLDKSFYEKASK